MIDAEDILGAAMERGWDEQMVEDLFEELGLLDWVRIANRAYPDYYASALGRNPANPAILRRFKEELSTVPRVNPDEYDILFNAEGSDIHRPGPTWDFVKWVPIPELQGFVPGLGWMAVILEEPMPFYHFSAVIRTLDTLGDRDFEIMRWNSTTLRGGQVLRDEMQERNEKKDAVRRRDREDEDEMLARDVRPLVKRMAEDEGI